MMVTHEELKLICQWCLLMSSV